MTKTKKDLKLQGQDAEMREVEALHPGQGDIPSGFYMIGMSLGGNVVAPLTPLEQGDFFHKETGEDEGILKDKRSGKVAYLTKRELDILRYINIKLYETRNDPDVQRGIRDAVRTAKEIAKKGPLKARVGPRPVIFPLVYTEIAKVIYGPHPTGRQIKEVQAAISTLLNKVYYTSLKEKGQGQELLGRGLYFFVEKEQITALRQALDENGNPLHDEDGKRVMETRVIGIGAEIGPQFLHEYDTRYLWSPRGFFNMRRKLGRDTDLFNFLELYLAGKVYSCRKHADENRAQAENKLKKQAKKENRKFDDKDRAKVQRVYDASLFHEESIFDFWRRVKRERYISHERDGSEKPHLAHLKKDLGKETDALKAIGLITSFDIIENSGGKYPVLRWGLNPDYRQKTPIEEAMTIEECTPTDGQE